MKANVRTNSIANELDDVLDAWDASIKQADRAAYWACGMLVVLAIALVTWPEWWR
jgi:hypothetical protein